MDIQRSKTNEVLNEKTHGFMIDTQLPDEVRESILKASFTVKPLNAIDFTTFP
jgi:hypothetical protein